MVTVPVEVLGSIPKPTLRGSQPPVTPALGGLTPSAGLCRYCIHVHIRPHTGKFKNISSKDKRVTVVYDY